MLRRYFVGAVFAALIAMAFIGCEGTAGAQYDGILQNVDTISGEVTVKLKDGSIIKFNLKNATVETLRAALGTASLEAGSQVTIEVDNDQQVRKVKARHAEVEGVIKSLDAAKKTLTVTAEENGDITLEVTAETEIQMEDEGQAAFADLRVGQEVEVKYDVETKDALKIEVEEEEDNEAEVEGVITSVNESAKTITIRGSNGVETSYRLTASTTLELHGAQTFEGLKTGMRVKAKVSRTDNELLKLELED
ncbi:MAG: hypothetical protein HYX97_01490 [Chloroflexi bacterium]|nr:hypothetical protein [Chloroflexota bacterium]